MLILNHGMKHLLLFIILLQINILYAQNSSITAGTYDSGMIYYNYNPDTVLPAGENGIYSCFIDIDLNFDSISDYKITNLNASGQNASNYQVEIVPYNDNEFSYHRIDSSYNYLLDTAYYYFVPSPVNYGEEINDSYLYTSAVSYLYMDRWSSISAYSNEIFDWDNIGPKYIAIRMNVDDTLYYGWIGIDISTKESQGGRSKVIVSEYALSKFLPSDISDKYYFQPIEIYPNPVTSDLNINLPKNFSSGNILILDVGGVIRRKIQVLNTGLVQISVSDLESGSYILRIGGNGQFYYKKIIKQ